MEANRSSAQNRLEILTRNPDSSFNLKSWLNLRIGIRLILADITSTQCSRSCASCQESFAHCNKTTGVCKSNCRRTKLCKRNNDLCLATWRWKNNRVVMFTSCFRLPPFSNSSQYNSKCQAAVLNGTRTCLCQGSGCNRKPIEPVKENWKQGHSSENPKLLRQKREYNTFLPCVYPCHQRQLSGPAPRTEKNQLGCHIKLFVARIIGNQAITGDRLRQLKRWTENVMILLCHSISLQSRTCLRFPYSVNSPFPHVP